MRIKSYDEYVEFEFHEKSGSFKTNKVLRFKRDHFNTATLSKRLRPLREKYQTKVAVLYTSQQNYEPVKLVKIEWNTGINGIEIKEGIEKTFKTEEPSILLNCYEVANKCILVSLEHCLKFINEELELITQISYRSFGYNIAAATCFHSGFGDRLRFIVSFSLVSSNLSFKPSSEFEGHNRDGRNSVVTLCCLNDFEHEFEIKSIEENSTVIYNENVASILEYAKEKLIIHVIQKDFLIIESWKVIKTITDPNDGNTNKFWMLQVPDFDEV